MPMVRTISATWRAHLRARRISGLLRLTEFAIAIGPAMNMALQAASAEFFLDLLAAIGAVGPHGRSRVARIENIFELLAVVHARVAHHVTAHEFVPAIDADVVLVTEIRAFMLLRPARVLVHLAVLGRLRFPVFQRPAFLDRLVLLARTEGRGYKIVLLGRHTIVASMICPPWRGSPCPSNKRRTNQTALPLRPPSPVPRDRATRSWRREPRLRSPGRETA